MSLTADSARLEENGNSVVWKEFFCDEEPHMFIGDSAPGYAPLQLGQVLETYNPGPKVRDCTFEIVRKLGWGQYSSVWLARTQGSGDIEGKYHAIKVLTYDATAASLNKILPEYDNLRAVLTKKEHPGFLHCTELLGRLFFDSIHGPHLCFVFDVMGSNVGALRDLQSPTKSFSVPVTKRIVKQTLIALDYLHRECKIVHTDLKPDNIFLSEGKKDDEIDRHLDELPSETYPARNEPDISPDPIERCLDVYKTLRPEELAAASKFIKKCLTLNPEDRPTARELLEDGWLEDTHV